MIKVVEGQFRKYFISRIYRLACFQNTKNKHRTEFPVSILMVVKGNL